jgi:enterobactin synthetase component D / holo-[acyl-carrier protein] synthase
MCFPLPESVSVAAIFDYSHVTSCASETALVERATITRRREFAAGRTCARRALRQLGVRPQPILAGRWGEPIWPCGIVGSISHSRSYCACAVANSRVFDGIGIDVEQNKPLKPAVLKSITLDEEKARLTNLESAAPEVNWDVILFSAKETAFKALFPARLEPMEFSDFSIFIDERQTTFEAKCVQRGPAGAVIVQGRWRIHGGFVLTAAALANTAEQEVEVGHSQLGLARSWHYA